jgi:regulator of replication initiation timing
MCYEESLHLLKTELDEAKEEAASILENTEKIVTENSFLRKELESKIQLLSKADNLGLSVNFLTL